MSILVTGARNGLGRSLSSFFDAPGLTRENAESIFVGAEQFDTVVHCAHSRAKDVTSGQLVDYLADSVDLTDRVLGLCRKTFILVSSVSVYPLAGHSLEEEEPILLDQVPNFYGVVKLMSEARVQKWAEEQGVRFVILRMSSMLGPYSPPNVTTRILSGEATKIVLSEKSRFSYVFHDEVCNFVALAHSQDLEGIYNIAAEDTISLKEVANIANRSLEFGPVDYQAPEVSIERAANLLPSLRRSSKDRIKEAVGNA